MAGDRSHWGQGDTDAAPRSISWGSVDGGAVEWDHLYRFYGPSLRRLIARRLPAGGPVDDVLQETFVRAIKSTRLIDTARPPWPFLATIAGRAVADWWSREGSTWPTEAPPSRMATDDFPGSEDHVSAMDRGLAARRALLALTPRHRRVLFLYEAHDRSYEALIDDEQISVQALKSVLGRARARFQRGYREGIGGSLGVVPWLRQATARLRARHPRWQHPVGAEAVMAMIGGFVAAGVVVAGAGSPGASATSSVGSSPVVPAAAIYVPPPLTSSGEGALMTNAAVQGTQSSSPSGHGRGGSAPPAPDGPVTAGVGLGTTPGASTASFWLVVHNPVLGHAHRVETETRCDQGQVAAKKCELLRALPESDGRQGEVYQTSK